MTVGVIGWTFDVLYAIFWSRIHKKMCVKVKKLTQISICSIIIVIKNFKHKQKVLKKIVQKSP